MLRVCYLVWLFFDSYRVASHRRKRCFWTSGKSRLPSRRGEGTGQFFQLWERKYSPRFCGNVPSCSFSRFFRVGLWRRLRATVNLCTSAKRSRPILMLMRQLELWGSCGNCAGLERLPLDVKESTTECIVFRRTQRCLQIPGDKHRETRSSPTLLEDDEIKNMLSPGLKLSPNLVTRVEQNIKRKFGKLDLKDFPIKIATWCSFARDCTWASFQMSRAVDTYTRGVPFSNTLENRNFLIGKMSEVHLFSVFWSGPGALDPISASQIGNRHE